MMLVSLYYVKTYRTSYPGPLKGVFIVAYVNAFLKVEIKSLLIPLDNWEMHGCINRTGHNVSRWRPTYSNKQYI